MEEVVGQRDGERGAVTEPPGAVGAAGGLRRQVPAHAAAAQLREAGPPALPLLPDDGIEAVRRIHWSSARNTEGVSQKPK